MTVRDYSQIALGFTGERYVPEIKGNIFLEHMHRYLIARTRVEGKDVLDIASGEGFGSFYMAEKAASVVGVDIAPEAVAHARQKYARDNLHFEVGSCAAIPLADNAVDVVVSFETIEHHDQHEEMMKEIKRVLRPGGLLIISSPEKREYSDVTAYRNPYHVKELYRDQFVDLVGRHFVNMALYGQRVIFGSGLFLEQKEAEVASYDSSTFDRTPGVQRPIYLVAIASDSVLETVPESSFFEQELLESEIVKLQLAVRDGAIELERNRSASLEKSIAELQEAYFDSLAWKLTRPLRVARRVVGRGIFHRQNLRAILHHLPQPIASRLRAARWRFGQFRSNIVRSKSNLTALNALVEESRAMSISSPSPMTRQLADADLPRVDISVVTYNSEKWVDGFVESLSALTYPREKLHIYFVDNSSQDGTLTALARGVEALALLGITAQVLSQPNKGFGAGHNAGLAAGNSEFCLVTNLDLVFEPDSLARVVSHAVSDVAEAVAWELRQKPYEHPKNYDPVSGATNWNSHACVLMRRSAFRAVGGYSDDLFMYGEDVELSYRFRANGFKLRFSPLAVVHHYTYESEREVKPLQLSGSTFANLYIRLSYGTWGDMAVVPMMALWLLLSPEHFPGARKKHFHNILKLLRLAPKLISRNLKRKTSAAFPFRGWDYDLIRQGAFHQLQALPADCPKVTVVTRTYKGREKLLLQAMKSVSNQTYPNIEHVITEDRGESLREFVQNYGAATGGDVVYLSGNKIGRSDAGNLALENAAGRWCVFLDDDDLFYCDHVEVLVQAILKDPEARAAYALAFEVPTRKEADDWSSYSIGYPGSHEFMAQSFDYETLKERNLFPIQVVLFERSLFVERGGFDEDLETLEDWALWQKYAYQTKFAYVGKTTSLYRTPEHKHHYQDRSQKFVEAYEGLVKRMDAWRTQWNKRSPVDPPPPAPAPRQPIELLFPIGHFYSPIADPTDIADRREKIFAKAEECEGIDFHDAEQLALLAELKPYVKDIVYPLAKPEGDNTTYFYQNDQYPVLDAEFLYSALCHFKPRNMIEIGSGFSSLITADVNRRILGGSLNFTCVEPFPRQFLIDGVEGITNLNISKVENLPRSYFDRLDDGDFLFIDSSHVSKVGSDVNYLFFEIIPRLKKGVIVHVHDIFLPDEYPEEWVLKQNRNWNEQYLLQAFLQFNSRWKIIWASHFMGTRYRRAVQETFPRYPNLGGGGSLWMRCV